MANGGGDGVGDVQRQVLAAWLPAAGQRLAGQHGQVPQPQPAHRRGRQGRVRGNPAPFGLIVPAHQRRNDLVV